MTGEEAVATIEREAAEAGVPYRTDVRDVIVWALDADPRTIPPYLEQARAEIARLRA